MSNDSYSWIVLVFVPFNSVLNPFLLHYNLILKRRYFKKIQQEKIRFFFFLHFLFI